MTTKEKILQFIEFKGISKRDFYRQTGLSNGFLDSGKHIGSDNLKIIISNYPELNLDWLVMDNGDMIIGEEKGTLGVTKPNVNENVVKKNDHINDHINDHKPNVNENVVVLENDIEKGESVSNGKKQRLPLTSDIKKKLQDIADGKYLKPKLIPVYGVSTIGGTKIGTDMSPVSEPEGYIEAGGWFPNITAAIYHYGESMKEYPSGCLLALQEIFNRRNIVWGSNYVIETNELRITKRLQTCPDDKNCVMAYSSNESTYSDGRLIHEPITIYKEEIRRLFLVIGVIKKEQASAPILIKV